MKPLLAFVLVLITLGAWAQPAQPVTPPVTPPSPPDASSLFGTNSTSLLSGPAIQALDFLATGSNWIVAPYGIVSSDAKKFGGGIAIGYHVSDYVVPTIRLDYYDGSVWMPSGSLQLQLPINVGKVALVPFAFTGIATPLAGKAKANGTPVGIFGIGAAVHITPKFGVVADYEEWTGFSSKQIRGGVFYRF